MSAVEIQQFIQTQLIQEADASVSTKEVSERFAQFHSKGRNNMHRALRELTGIEAGVKFYSGYRLTIGEAPAVSAPAVSAPAVSAPAVVATFDIQTLMAAMQAQNKADPELIAIEKEKLNEARIARETAMTAEKDRLTATAELAEKAERAKAERLTVKAELAFGLKKIDMEMEQKKLDHQRELQEQKLAWGSLENNKPRLLTIMTPNSGFNQYRDLVTYGSPAQKLVETESAVKVLCGTAFVHTTKFVPGREDCFKKAIEEKSTKELVLTKDGERELDVIDIDECEAAARIAVDKMIELKLIDDSEELNATACIKECIKDFIENIAYVKSIHNNLGACTNAVSAHQRAKEREQAKTDKGKSDHRNCYGRCCNRVVASPDGTTSSGECFTCGARLDFTDAGTHRSHDVAKNLSGSWDRENVYITCATCNLNMQSNQVIDYKLAKYAELKNC